MESELVSRGSPHVACDGLGLGHVSRKSPHVVCRGLGLACLGLGQVDFEFFAVFIDDADNHSEDEDDNENSDDVLPMRPDE